MSNNILNEKKKMVKEGFSNWRHDLSEVMDTIEKEENDKEITEKKVKNKIKINPNLGEAVEQLGGTLLEMTEIEDFEGVFDELSESDIFFLTDDLIEEVVEEVFIESIQEGYNIFEIENTLLESLEVSSALLNEAKVTYGHDTDVKSDRLEKVKSAVKKVGKGILRGAGYVAGAAVRGAKAAGRELSAGYKRGRYGAGGSSDSDSSSPTSTQSDSDSDSTDSGSSKPGLLGRIGSALKKGLKKIIHKGAKAVQRGAGAVARRTADRSKVTQGKGVETQDTSSKVTQGKGSTATTQSTPSSSKKSPDPWGEPTTPPKASSKPQTSSKPQAKTTKVASSSLVAKRKAAAMRAVRKNPNISKDDLDRITSSIDEENYKIFEKAESKQQQKLFGLALSVKRGETPRSEVSDEVLKIVDSMSEKKIRDFAKTSHEGLPKKVQTKEEVIRDALLDKMFEKIEEQSLNYYEIEDEMIDEAKRTRQERRESNKGKKGYDAQGKSTPKVSKTKVIHDVDDNIADQRHPDAAKIDVMRNGKKVQSLTPSQFAHHNKDPEDQYGFDQFKDTKLFKKTTKPNKPVVRLGDSPKRPASKSIVTARGPKQGTPSTPMDDTKGFVDDLRKRIGVRGLKRKDVHFTGGMSQGSGPEKKGEVVKKIVESDTKKVITTDDHLQNARHMARAASNPDRPVSGPKVIAYQSKPATKQSGKIKTGDIVPVRVGKEGNLNDPKIGIRQNTNPPTSPKENQRRRKKARRGMKESYDDSGFRQHSVSITSSSNSSNTPSKTASLMSTLKKLGLMSSPKKKKKKKKSVLT
jgi:hypothetical protein